MFFYPHKFLFIAKMFYLFFVIYKPCLEQTNLILVLIYHKLNFITNNFFFFFFSKTKNVQSNIYVQIYISINMYLYFLFLFSKILVQHNFFFFIAVTTLVFGKGWLCHETSFMCLDHNNYDCFTLDQ